jgi:hypothetical protein
MKDSNNRSNIITKPKLLITAQAITLFNVTNN